MASLCQRRILLFLLALGACDSRGFVVGSPAPPVVVVSDSPVKGLQPVPRQFAEADILSTSITPITSISVPSSGFSYSGDSYSVRCTVSGTVTLYPAVHDGTSWTVFQNYLCNLDATVETDATCVFPAAQGAGLTWNAFKTGSGSVSSCTASARTGPPPPPGAPPITGTVIGTVSANQGTGAGANAPWSMELSDGSSFYTAAKTGQFPSALVGGRFDINIGASSATVPISAAALPLPSGAATSALQTTGNTSLSSIDGKFPVQGQATMAASLPVAIASNQSAIPISGTVTVASTTANQGTGAGAGAPWSMELSDGSSFYTAAKTGQLPTALTGSGNLKCAVVESTATQTVTGTVTANIGTTGGLCLDTSVNGILVAQASTTSGQSGPLIQGAVTTSAPSYTTAKTSPLSLNTSGGLRVDGSGVTQPVSGTVTANQGGAPWSQNITQVGGSSLALGQAAMAASVPVAIASNQSAVPVSGTITVTSTTANQGTGAGAGAPWSMELSDGSAFYTAAKTGQFPTSLGQTTKANSLSCAWPSDQVGTAGTASSTVVTVQGIASMTPVQVSQATASNLNATVTGSGSAGTPASGVLTVQGITSMTALKTDGSATTQPVSGTLTCNIGTSGSLALDTSVNGLLLSQNSTTSGQTGPLVQGAVTTAAPSYTTAKTSPLSLTTAGALRTDSSATTQPVSQTGSFSSFKAQVEGPEPAGSAAPGRPVQVGGNDTSGNVRELYMDTTGRAIVVGAAAAGSAVAGNPLLCGGSDGTNARSLSTDTSGRLGVIGGAASGSAVAGNPVLIAGQDGTNARSLRLDPTGRPAGSSFKYTAANETVTLKSGEGVLRSICTTALGATSAIAVYDNTAASGTQIVGLGTAAGQGCYVFNARAATGITYQTTGGTPATLTITYD